MIVSKNIPDYICNQGKPILYISGLVKEEYLMIILGELSQFLHKKICCGYSLEVSQWGASYEYPEHIFFMEK